MLSTVKLNWHVGNLSRNTKGTVGAQYGHVSSSSWGTVGAQLGQKAQYGHSMARFSKGTVWTQFPVPVGAQTTDLRI